MTKSHVEMRQSTETLKEPLYGCVLDKLEDDSMENMLDEILQPVAEVQETKWEALTGMLP
jgi:hypothetical protein